MQDTNQASDAQRLLLEWAKWKASGEVRLGYPSRAAFATPKAGLGATITDDVAMAVDRAVSALRAKGGSRYPVLAASYLLGLSDAAIATSLGMARQSVKVARTAAEAWVEAFVEVQENG